MHLNLSHYGKPYLGPFQLKNHKISPLESHLKAPCSGQLCPVVVKSLDGHLLFRLNFLFKIDGWLRSMVELFVKVGDHLPSLRDHEA